MGILFRNCTSLSVLWILAVGAGQVRPDPPNHVATDPKAHRAIERGLEFLRTDAAKWRKDRQCSTCHHGTMTVWAFAEVKSRGYPVPESALADAAKWSKDRVMDRIDLPRDKRPGWSMVNTPAMYLSVMAFDLKEQDLATADDLKRIAGHLVRHQEADGAWSWASAPPKNRPPPFFESDEVATLLGYLALGPEALADPKESPEVGEARKKAAAWLAKTKPTDTTQAAVLWLLVKVRSAEPAKAIQAEVERLLGRQNKDSGWGQTRGAASDAYATGQAIYALSVAGVKTDREEVRRAVAFLVDSQKEDGSWPMTRRSHPGVSPSDEVVPIIYFGSAWSTLGLMRSVPK